MVLENRSTLSFWSKGTGVFAAYYKRFGIRFLKCKPVHVQMLSGFFHVTLWGLGLWEPVQESADTLATDIDVSNKILCV